MLRVAAVWRHVVFLLADAGLINGYGNTSSTYRSMITVCYLDKMLSTKSMPFFVQRDASRFRRRVRVALVLSVTWLVDARSFLECTARTAFKKLLRTYVAIFG